MKKINPDRKDNEMKFEERKQTCGACDSYDQRSDDPNKGFCRCNPPQVYGVVMGVRAPTVRSAGKGSDLHLAEQVIPKIQEICSYPTVMKNDKGCKEFEPAKTPEPETL